MSRPSLTAVPAQRSSLPNLKIRRRLVIGLVSAALVSGGASTVAWLAQEDPAPQTVAARSERAVALATVVANDFLQARDSSVGAAEGVRVDFSKLHAGAQFQGATPVFAGSAQYQVGDQVSATLERVTFTVAGMPGGGTYELTVPMVQTAKSWALAAAPSLLPGRAASGAAALDYSKIYANSGDASTLSSQPTGKQIVEQVERWATAYAAAGARSPELFAITGDSDSSHTYTGLGGWSVKKTSVVSYFMKANAPDDVKKFGEKAVVVRVALVLAPPAANGPTVTSEYDVLLQPGQNPAAPPVTAWGPAGAGQTPLLTNYYNSATAAA